MIHNVISSLIKLITQSQRFDFRPRVSSHTINTKWQQFRNENILRKHAILLVTCRYEDQANTFFSKL